VSESEFFVLKKVNVKDSIEQDQEWGTILIIEVISVLSLSDVAA